MKRLLLLVVLLLAGCSIDTSATDEREPQLNYPFNVQFLGLLPAKKFQQHYGFSETIVYNIYSTEEQIAFLKSNEAHLRVKVNSVRFEKIDIVIGAREQLDDVVLYSAQISIPLADDVVLDDELTSIALFIQDRELLWTEHSRVKVLTEVEVSTIKGELTGDDADHFVYTLTNDAYEDVEIKRLYVEGVNGVQIDFEGFPQVIQQKGELRLTQKTLDYNEQRIQGPLGIYVVFADNSEQFIGFHNYFLAVEKETLLKAIVENVRAQTGNE